MTKEQANIDTALFCDLKTDEEKSNFFLSGRGYETGVIAQAIQNDVAMAYHRCSEYRKEMEDLQAEYDKLRTKTRVTLGVGDGRGDMFVYGDYDSIKRVQALILECENLRKDAERYRWLRARWGRIADEYDGDSDQLVAIREADSHFEGWDVDPDSLDRAIDNAIEEDDKA